VKIISFVEGAEKGSQGIVGVPMILASTAAQGHSIVVGMGGPPSLGAEKYAAHDLISAQNRKEGIGSFGIVNLKAWTRWKFCPSILWRFNRVVRESDCVTLHSLYSFPVLAGFLLARLHRKPYAFWPHGVLAPFQRRVGARHKWIYNKLFGDRIMKNASLILYSAEGERSETEALRLSPPSVIATEGFNPKEFANLPGRGRFRSRFFNGHGGPLVLFLARLNAKKGVDLLIQAMQRVIALRPDARLAIVGPPDPPAFNKLVMNWIHESGIGANTAVTGSANPQVRLEAYADADVYVLPSHAENFGFTIFEAMASGLPVVVSDTLNFAKDFVTGGAGFAIPRRAEDFADRILTLLNHPEMRREMGECGRKLARTYSWSETGAKVSKALESVVQHRPFPAELLPRLGSESLEVTPIGRKVKPLVDDRGSESRMDGASR
jgi:glycosyltransferase involved in cell wall biosynthesis